MSEAAASDMDEDIVAFEVSHILENQGALDAAGQGSSAPARGAP